MKGYHLPPNHFTSVFLGAIHCRTYVLLLVHTYICVYVPKQQTAHNKVLGHMGDVM